MGRMGKAPMNLLANTESPLFVEDIFSGHIGAYRRNIGEWLECAEFGAGIISRFEASIFIVGCNFVIGYLRILLFDKVADRAAFNIENISIKAYFIQAVGLGFPPHRSHNIAPKFYRAIAIIHYRSFSFWCAFIIGIIFTLYCLKLPQPAPVSCRYDSARCRALCLYWRVDSVCDTTTICHFYGFLTPYHQTARARPIGHSRKNRYYGEVPTPRATRRRYKMRQRLKHEVKFRQP